MSDPGSGFPPKGHIEILALVLVAALATAVRLADDVPKTAARFAWLMVVGLGLATGGWLMAKAMGLDGWAALAVAWGFGVIGSEGVLPIVRRWLDRKA